MLSHLYLGYGGGGGGNSFYLLTNINFKEYNSNTYDLVRISRPETEFQIQQKYCCLFSKCCQTPEDQESTAIFL